MSDVAVRVPDGYQARGWDLGGGQGMTILLPNPSTLTRENIARLRRYVDALEFEAAICWDDGAESPSPAAAAPAVEPPLADIARRFLATMDRETWERLSHEQTRALGCLDEALADSPRSIWKDQG